MPAGKTSIQDNEKFPESGFGCQASLGCDLRAVLNHRSVVLAREMNVMLTRRQS